MLINFADDLKKWREEKGLTLQQVASKTKIDLRKLEALEDGDFAFLPEIYIKAFLKDYAKAIGLSEQFVLGKYESAKQGKYFESENQIASIPAPEEKKEIKKEKKIEKPAPEPVKLKKEKTNQSFDAVSSGISDMNKGSRNNNLYLLLSILAGVVVVGILIYYVFIASGPEIIREGTDYGQDTEMTSEESNTGERYEEAAPMMDTTTTAAPIQQDSLILTISVTSNARLRVNPDSTSTQELVIAKDESRTFKADRNFTLLFYNTAAVHLNLNNKPVDYRPQQPMEKILLDSTYTYKMLKIYPKKKSNEQPGTTKD